MERNLDGVWDRCVVYELNAGSKRNLSQGSVRNVGLASFEELECRARDVASLIEVGFSEFEGTIASIEVRAGSRRIEKARPNCPLSILHESYLVINAIVRAGDTLTPVRWQHAGGDASRQLGLDLEGDLYEEMVAAVTGEPLRSRMNCPVILAPILSVQLIHECIGHSSEADNYLAYMQPHGLELGYRWCKYPINVYDDPTMEGHRASYEVDDDGYPARRAQVVTDGRWTDLLTSVEFAKEVMRPAGHGRRTVGARTSLPRMSNMWLSEGTECLQDLIYRVRDGMLCGGTWGGGSVGLNFIVRPSFGRVIESGKLSKQYVNRFDIFGNKCDAIGSISGVSTLPKWFCPVFGCDKFGQDDLPVSFGAPAVLMTRASLRPITNGRRETRP